MLVVQLSIYSSLSIIFQTQEQYYKPYYRHYKLITWFFLKKNKIKKIEKNINKS